MFKKFSISLLFSALIISAFIYGLTLGHYKFFPFYILQSVKSGEIFKSKTHQAEISEEGLFEETFIEADFSIPYKEIKSLGDDAVLMLHIFLPISFKANKTVIFLHGGGWRSGSAKKFFKICDSLSKVGIGCASADYRIASKHHTNPIHALEDARHSIEFVRSNGDIFGLSTDNIWLGGTSAGGQLAAAVAMSTIPQYDIRPLALEGLILYDPVINVIDPSDFGYERIRHFPREFSPMQAKFTPKIPVLLQIGSEDHHTSPEEAAAFVERFQNVGTDALLKVYDGEEHGWFDLNKENLEKTTNVVIEFLMQN